MSTRLDLEYDGSGFRGWAVQPGQRTVCGELEPALATLLGRPVSLSVAGRTDAGVHAWGQVASFEGEPDPNDLRRRLNAVLPDDVAVIGTATAAAGFDARRDARSRTYCYRVLTRSELSPFERGRSLWWPRRLDHAALADSAQTLVGSHDFSAFTPTDNYHVHFERQVFRAEWEWEDRENASEGMGGVLCLWIEADAFLHSMVRALVGTMLEVAGGRRTPAELAALLRGAPRAEAGETAPAHGLYLASVRY